MPLRCTGARLTLASRQFTKLVLFYRQFLSLEPAVLIPNVYAEFHLPTLNLGIFHPREIQAPLPTPQDPAGMSLCLDVDDLEAAIAHLTQLGYPPPGEIMTASHGREIDAYDPEGNWLILHQAALTYNEG
ncbi:VOC family protein [Stenomitos frigidus]|uniref:Glyoxalase n=1 Tax=Stenomitos frigidus ULC18 TaxID=2107698 RepID=A0A2T1DWZ3_9CYAN|nr:VOC family protein [Stenomitos frigidus]PSB24904.1 glyoxalase [Stenomitos frigidus ULC18]